MITTKSLVKKFRTDLEIETGIKLDFRTHQFINNQHGATPCFDYSEAKEVIAHLYKWGEEFIETNREYYPHFGGWVYNLDMAVEQLRTTRLKVVVEDICHDLFINHVEIFRREGNKVFKYSPENRAYLFDHTI